MSREENLTLTGSPAADRLLGCRVEDQLCRGLAVGCCCCCCCCCGHQQTRDAASERVNARAPETRSTGDNLATRSTGSALLSPICCSVSQQTNVVTISPSTHSLANTPFVVATREISQNHNNPPYYTKYSYLLDYCLLDFRFYEKFYYKCPLNLIIYYIIYCTHCCAFTI